MSTPQPGDKVKFAKTMYHVQGWVDGPAIPILEGASPAEIAQIEFQFAQDMKGLLASQFPEHPSVTAEINVTCVIQLHDGEVTTDGVAEPVVRGQRRSSGIVIP